MCELNSKTIQCEKYAQLQVHRLLGFLGAFATLNLFARIHIWHIKAKNPAEGMPTQNSKNTRKKKSESCFQTEMQRGNCIQVCMYVSTYLSILYTIFFIVSRSSYVIKASVIDLTHTLIIVDLSKINEQFALPLKLIMLLPIFVRTL